jgi:hypothetical protein
MLNLSIEDQAILTNYVGQVRRLAVFCQLDDDEIVREIEDHLKQEIDKTTKPITQKDIEDIIKNLGNPREWIGEGESSSWWRRMAWKLWRGPDDWRV